MWILIAFVLVVGLIALAVYGVYQEFGTASNQQTAQSVLTTTSAVISNLLTDYAGNPNYSSLSSTTVENDGAVPNSWVVSSNGFSIPGGGTASFASANVNSGSDNGFALTLSNLNKQTCAEFGSYYTPNTSSISINGTAATNPDYNGGGANSTWPPALAGDCSSTKANSVVITVAGQ
jgi:type II secretory pathway pseudopilin PulG